jgi:glucose/arabinose dehydrogenase
MSDKFMKKLQIVYVLTVLLMVVSTACAQNTREPAKTSASPASTTPQCAPLETRTPNAPEQKPAFPGQTRACAVKSEAAFEVTVLAKGLDKPWAVEPLPGGDFLVTEKSVSRSAGFCRSDRAACPSQAVKAGCRRSPRGVRAVFSTLL